MKAILPEAPKRRLRVLMITEGTYPFHWGGVSTWCHLLIRDLPTIDFELISLAAEPNMELQFTLPHNVTAFHPIPLWGVRERLETRQDLTFAELRARRQRTSEAAIYAYFVPYFRDFVQELFLNQRGPQTMAQAIHAMYRFFLTYDFDATMRSKPIWDTFVSVAQESFPLATAQFGYPDAPFQLADLTTAMHWLYHWFFPLGAPLPKTDVAHAAMVGICTMIGVTAKLEHGAAFMLTEHGIYLRERYLAEAATTRSFFLKVLNLSFARRMTELTYALADQISPCCDYNQRWELRNGAKPEQIRTIYYGVDGDSFTPVVKPFGDPPVVVWVGRIDPLKDLLTLIRAAAVVHQTRPDIQFKLFGSAPAGNEAYYEKCLELRKELGLEETVIFAGFRSDVAAAFNEGDVVILSSISEAFPFVILEAMLCAKPVVATGVGGIPEQVEGCGFALEPRNPEAMAATILHLMSDPELCAKLGQAARAKASREFTVRQSGLSHNASYRRILKRHQHWKAQLAMQRQTGRRSLQPDLLRQQVGGHRWVGSAYYELLDGGKEVASFQVVPQVDNGKNGEPGKNGQHSKNGHHGQNAHNRHSRSNGHNGRNGHGEANGYNGKNGSTEYSRPTSYPGSKSANGQPERNGHQASHRLADTASHPIKIEPYRASATVPMLITDLFDQAYALPDSAQNGPKQNDSVQNDSKQNGNALAVEQDTTNAGCIEMIAALTTEVAQRDQVPIDALEITAIIESMGVTDEVARQRYEIADAFALGEKIFDRLRSTRLPLPTPPATPLPPPSSWEVLRDASRGIFGLLPAMVLMVCIFVYSTTGQWGPNIVLALSAGMTSSMLITNGIIQALSRRTSIYLGMQKAGLAGRFLWQSAALIFAGLLGLDLCGLLITYQLGIFTMAEGISFSLAFLSLSALWMVASSLALIQRTSWLSLAMVCGLLVGTMADYLLRAHSDWHLMISTTVGYSVAVLMIIAAAHSGYTDRHLRHAKTPQKFYWPSRSYLLHEAAPYFTYGFLYMAFILLPHILGWLGTLGVHQMRSWAVTSVEIGLTLSMPPLILANGMAEHTLRRFWRYTPALQAQTTGQDLENFRRSLHTFHYQYATIYLIGLTLLSIGTHMLFTLGLENGILARWVDLPNSTELLFIFNAGLIAYGFLGLGIFNCMFCITVGAPQLATQAVSWGLVTTLLLGAFLSRIHYTFSALAFIVGALVFVIVAWRMCFRILQSADYRFAMAL